MLVRKIDGAAYVAGAGDARCSSSRCRVVVFVLYNNHLKGAGTFDFVSRHVLSAPLGSGLGRGRRRHLADPGLLTTIVLALALYGARERRREASFVAWMLVLTSFTIGELRQPRRARVLHLLRAHPGAELLHHRGLGWGAARAAALKFFIYTFGGSAFLFIGILYLGFLHQHQTGGALTFSDTRTRLDGADPRHVGVAVPRLRGRFRGEVADLAPAHLVAASPTPRRPPAARSSSRPCWPSSAPTDCCVSRSDCFPSPS